MNIHDLQHRGYSFFFKGTQFRVLFNGYRIAEGKGKHSKRKRALAAALTHFVVARMNETDVSPRRSAIYLPRGHSKSVFYHQIIKQQLDGKGT